MRRLIWGVVIATTVAMGMNQAAAQTIALVNGDPITQFDIDQRAKLIQISTQKTPTRNEVIEELIGEKLKINLLKRFMIDGIDKDVDNAFANMARRMRSTPRDFTETLGKQGVKVETIKSRIKADLIWGQIIRGRYQSNFQFSDQEVNARLQSKNRDDAGVVGFEYTLRPILFLVPRGSPPAAFEARAKEAEALRSRFQSCDEGIALARNLRFVAVRPPVVRGSADLPPPIRDMLAKTEVGRLTTPETTQQGVEVQALCGKRQSDNAPAKKEIRDEMFNEQFAIISKKFLKELRDQAMIEFK
ncbi:MAG: peptidylprolyl isomerase [Alphaproteobacteria bacterium]|nr:peptidylprolyl isomerase [Alphaproteobacteria bacterium]